jgi:hypothetical protein
MIVAAVERLEANLNWWISHQPARNSRSHEQNWPNTSWSKFWIECMIVVPPAICIASIL